MNPTKNKRSNPEEILKRVQEEEFQQRRGKLRIYLGAAPGVGKTYAMLQDALTKREQGLDVVVGIAESHGREPIENFLKHLEVLPKKNVDYRGIAWAEFDLDLALKRNPSLIVIDEMAHTNVPGLRHTKRWQDIIYVLDRGIDVYTTLNVQHIESLNDIVWHIIHVPIKETVPDSIIDLADTVELVDLPPDDLLKRLQEGKVYFPQQAELAKESFFRKGNLMALRELALRATAARVGDEIFSYRQDQGMQHIRSTAEKILVCVGPGVESLKLIRAACRLAASLQAKWIAVYVDSSQIQLSETQRNQAIKNLRFAEQLGAETRMLTGLEIVDEIVAFARRENMTLIMVWKPVRSRLREWISRRLPDEIMRQSGDIDVYIMTGFKEGEKKQKKSYSDQKKWEWGFYGVSVAMVALASAFNVLLSPYVNSSNLILIYVLATVIVALSGQLGPAVLASVLSVLAYDVFFTAHAFSFAMEGVDTVTLFVMLCVTQVVGYLTILTRRQTDAARAAERQTAALHHLSRQLASTRGRKELIEVGVHYLSEVFDSEASLLFPEEHFRGVRDDEKGQGVAQWVYDKGQAAGLGTDTLPSTEALYLPMLAAEKIVGVLRLKPRTDKRFTLEQRSLLEGCATQVALALEAERLYGEYRE